MRDTRTLTEILRLPDIGRCDLAEDMGVDCEGHMCDECITESLARVADRIDREYIPRPRFEDGEPVQFGDEVRAEGSTLTVREMAVSEDGTWHLRESDLRSLGGRGDTVQRPTKVLDADGVEIKVGDRVWNKKTGEEYTVLEYKHSGIQVKSFDGGYRVIFNPSSLTHKEPDSLEKLRDDIRATYALGIRADLIAVHAWSDRLTALIERDA